MVSNLFFGRHYVEPRRREAVIYIAKCYHILQQFDGARRSASVAHVVCWFAQLVLHVSAQVGLNRLSSYGDCSSRVHPKLLHFLTSSFEAIFVFL